jgi:DNA polymerase-3 subunit alpha
VITPLKIKSIKRHEPAEVYDIQVRKNHNFLANGMVVHNCVIFQEQLMSLCSVVGGFPEEVTDSIRRNLLKRKLNETGERVAKVRAIKEQFVSGAVANGVDAKIADDLYEKMLFFAGYGFNKCVHCETEVNTYSPEGNLVKKQIQHVEPGDLVMTRDEKAGEDMLTRVVKRHHNGVKKLYEITLDTGEKVKCTMDHKFRTTDGRMLPLKQILEEGASIATKDQR